MLKVGIAGLGRSGWNIHAACCRSLGERFKVVAAADQIGERIQEAEREDGARVFDDYRDLIAAGGFDLFVNALPTNLHVGATVEALAAGYHVVCEKPAAPEVAGFDRMTAAAAKSPGELFLFQNNRLQPFFDRMLEVVESGVLGRLLHVRSTWGGFKRRWDWQTRQENSGGILYNTGPHAVDQALMFFAPSFMPEVFCRMDSGHMLGGDADDICSVTLFDRQRNNPVVEIHLTSYLRFPPPYMYSVCGTLGTMVANHRQVKWSFYDPEATSSPDFWPSWSENRRYPEEEIKWHEGRWTLDEEQARNPVGYTLPSLPIGPSRFYLNLHDVLFKGEEPLIKAEQVRRQVAVMEECHRQNPLPVKPAPAAAGNEREMAVAAGACG